MDWKWPYALTVTLSGLIWKLGGLALLVHANEVGRLTVQLFIVGMVAGGVMTCALIDIDLFKKINDSFGHSAGDRVLRQLSDVLLREFRTSDVCGRLGGEEFAVLLPDTDTEGATAVAERFRSAIAHHAIEWQEHRIQVTVSIGIASRSTGPSELTERLHEAHMAM